jgi:hypothetical protein
MARYFFTAPNTQTNVAIHLKLITRRKSPYSSNCSAIFPPELQPFAPEGTAYSDGTCKNMCKIKYMQMACNCTDPLLMDARQEFNHENTKFCSTLENSIDRQCVHNATSDYSKDTTKACPCQLECRELLHEVSFTCIARCMSLQLW